jgi:hypothetical protein
VGAGGRGEDGPARVVVVVQVRALDCPAGVVGVQAGTLRVLQLGQFKQPGLLGGGTDQIQHAMMVRQQDAARANAQQLGAADSEPLQEVDDVEVGHQGVGQLDEDLPQLAVCDRHTHSSSPRGALCCPPCSDELFPSSRISPETDPLDW